MHGGMASGCALQGVTCLQDNQQVNTYEKESQVEHLGGYLGHVVEGAKCHKAIQQGW